METTIKIPIWNFTRLDEMYQALGAAQFDWDDIPGAWFGRDVDVGMEKISLTYGPTDWQWEVSLKYMEFDFAKVDAPSNARRVHVKIDMKTLEEKAVIVEIGNTIQIIPKGDPESFGIELAERIIGKFEEVNHRGNAVRARCAS